MTEKTTEDRLKDKDLQIEKLRERMKNDSEKIKKIEKEKEQIVNSEIQGVLREINLPLPEVLEMLKGLKN